MTNSGGNILDLGKGLRVFLSMTNWTERRRIVQKYLQGLGERLGREKGKKSGEVRGNLQGFKETRFGEKEKSAGGGVAEVCTGAV